MNRLDIIQSEYNYIKHLPDCPYPCLEIPNFLNDKVFIQNVIKECSKLDYKEVRSDLMKFQQCLEVNVQGNIHINSLIKNITNKCKEPLEKAFNFILDDSLIVTSSIYGNGGIFNFILTGQRAIAFVYYLVDENWDETYGGSLQLMSIDEKLKPVAVTKNIVPKRDSLVLFKVHYKSYHCVCFNFNVSEILTNSKRLTINGWFMYREQLTLCDMDALLQNSTVISPVYNSQQTLRAICKSLQAESAIELKDFLSPIVLEQTHKFFESVDETDWHICGPMDASYYHILRNQMCQKFQNTLMNFLEHVYFKIVNDECTFKEHISRWNEGCYSLANAFSKSDNSMIYAYLYIAKERVNIMTVCDRKVFITTWNYNDVDETPLS
ncbi:hypothetical protein A3Q56_04740 [Intoshia linei]|uniref:Prolyl 4-hydroxylase alpha subunit domain-containing protein n=1 Tax=Intoshia linei TaxID=1819745 RepID=A0A177AZU4_9BILA|nr:hypothetical protein A3Q56_04740 [Intoshia linei]